MDYESEEEDGVEDAEDKEDQAEEEEVGESEEKNPLEESQPECEGVRLDKKKKKKKKKQAKEEECEEGEEEAMSQMRINSVLQSNTAIERYCYDHQHELWCEVRCLS